MGCAETDHPGKEPSTEGFLSSGIEGIEQPRNSFKLGEGFPQRTAKKGQRKGATSKNVKNRQKVPKIFSTLFAQGKKRRESSKSVKKVFDTF